MAKYTYEKFYMSPGRGIGEPSPAPHLAFPAQAEIQSVERWHKCHSSYSTNQRSLIFIPWCGRRQPV